MSSSKKAIREDHKYSQFRQGTWNDGDARVGHGYGTLKPRMSPRPSGDGFPYLIDYKTTDDEEDIDNVKMAFGDEDNLQKFISRSDLDTQSFDSPNDKRDPFAFFDDATVGLYGEGNIRSYIRCIFEDIFRLRSRSSEPDGVVNQFGIVVPGGTQFGWSSAYPFKDIDSYKPITSLRDALLPDEEKTQIDKLDDDWKEKIAINNFEKERLNK